ncbi:MAG: hypothetical protein AAB436_02445 [Patescibacteria group bacterium]
MTTPEAPQLGESYQAMEEPVGLMMEPEDNVAFDIGTHMTFEILDQLDEVGVEEVSQIAIDLGRRVEGAPSVMVDETLESKYEDELMWAEDAKEQKRIRGLIAVSKAVDRIMRLKIVVENPDIVGPDNVEEFDMASEAVNEAKDVLNEAATEVLELAIEDLRLPDVSTPEALDNLQ